ncbi:MAG: sulfide/dihydroorotate dehydrogenase-like FAD/NAD-binding protein [Candidatus Omnitrophica bacterium]|nr:sulfide/dihydroorotate dehydrogenase-like FAD/NAD-binding protein [Candidatus Omnitrophota bacterium]
MFEIKNKIILAEDIKRLDVYAPDIAAKSLPGQFVSICPEEGDERIPLTVIDSDFNKGMISIIFRECGSTTKKLGKFSIGEKVSSILGPLGLPARIESKGLIVCIATDMGTAQILPICRAHRKAGCKVIGIIGAKTKRQLLLEAQMRLSCDKLHVRTEDGSYVKRGVATDVLKSILQEKKVDLVYVIGSIEFMQSVVSISKKQKIKTRVQLKPVMVDCMGMCGACRVKVGGEMVLACCDGPEFDGHKVDFDDFSLRQKAFEEAGTCQNSKSPFSRKNGGAGILTKLFSDIIEK